MFAYFLAVDWNDTNRPACCRLVVVLGFGFINFLPLLTETTWVSWMRFRDTSVRSWPGLFLTSVTVTHPNQATKSRRVIIKAWGAEKRIPMDTIFWKSRVSWCLRSAASSMVSWHLAWNFWSAAALKYLQISHVIEANPWCWSPVCVRPLGEHFREIFRPLSVMIALSWNTLRSQVRWEWRPSRDTKFYSNFSVCSEKGISTGWFWAQPVALCWEELA